jgi:hypothetical protein
VGDLPQKLTDRIQHICEFFFLVFLDSQPLNDSAILMVEQREDARDEESEGDLITSVSLGNCEENVKRLLVQHNLKDHLSKHETLILNWALDVAEL